MPTKTEIFNDIIQIMKTDYAGASEKEDMNRPEDYLITDDMADRDFIETVQSYLLDFKDGHLSFNAKGAVIPNLGFRVRRHQNELYVTEATEENRLQKGDEILEMDGLTIEDFGNRHAKVLEDNVLDRQFWNVALRQAKDLTVLRDGVKFNLTLATYERTPYTPVYTLEKLNPDTVYMKLTDFGQEEPMLDLLDKHREDLSRSTNLIIDVRVNYGGNDLFYFPLLDYVFEGSTPFKSLFQEGEIMYTNYTERNCRLWINELKGYLEQELDAETEKWAQGEIALFAKNKGSGFQAVQEEMDYTIQGQAAPPNVYVLTDVTCASSGDTFASNVKKSSKVKVIGRPTMGIVDFCNVVTMDYGDYEFGYSISKMDENYYTNETGVEPDIHIPWTPRHLEEDVDLEYVLGEIESKSIVSKKF
ncbi:S41 family peptidase [Planococcus sp. X10-3]|uniref:S41 family peptidase n=1 Tax=Planococcus sp. X10-3 TaxID=3061240 RepID=UPI003BAE1974